MFKPSSETHCDLWQIIKRPWLQSVHLYNEDKDKAFFTVIIKVGWTHVTVV